MRAWIQACVTMLVVILASSGLAQSDFNHPDLRSLEQLTAKYHWVLLLDHYFVFGSISSPFVLVKDGVSREFSADPRYQDARHHRVSSPRLSPDAKEIAYVGFDGKAAQLVVINVDTRKTVSIDLEEESYAIKGWSQDGSQVAVAGDHQISFIRVSDGSVAKKIQGTGWQSFSPDWRHAIIWIDKRTQNSLDGVPELFVVDLESGARRYLVDGWGGSWFPKGDQVVYVAREQKEIMVTSSAGGKSERLFARSFFQDSPYTFDSPLVWSPDGRFLAFHREAGSKGYYRTPLIYDLQEKRRLSLPYLAPLEIVDWK